MIQMAETALPMPPPGIVINGEVFYQPHHKQHEFHAAYAPNVLYGGAAGGGKSHGIRMDAYMRCLSRPNMRVLLLRRTWPELRDTHIDKVQIEVERLGGYYLKSEGTAIFPHKDGDSKLQFGHCEDDAAVAKYLSTEYDAIYFDELVTFTLQMFKFIASRARSTKSGVLPCVRCASNPGGEASYWVKRYFILKDITKEEDPAYEPDNYLFIRATLDDNPHIDATYEARLMALPTEALRRAYRYGDWDSFEGQYFNEWRTFDDEGRPYHVIYDLPTIDGRPITQVPWIEHFRALDWGWRDNGVCGWYACLADGRLIKTQEFVFREMLAKDVAKEIRERSRGMRIRYTVADPKMFSKEGTSGESLAETFGRNKVPLIKADHERLQGWMRLHAWLKETTMTGDGQQIPLIQFFAPGCPYTVRTIPQMVVDPAKPEDIKCKHVEDHAADETRYAVMSRPSPSRTPTLTPGIQPFRMSAEARKLMRASDRRRLGWESRHVA